MTIRKAVILAAGWGTRLLPATKTVPKEMLPLVDRPIIHYAVEEAKAAGMDQIILVTARGKESIENYFDRSWELEQLLESRGEAEILRQVRAVSEMAEMTYVRQHEQRGIGHALLTAERLVGGEPFALFFPDDVIDAPTPAIGQMLEVYQHYGGSVLAVEPVAPEDSRRYGIVEVQPVTERVYRVLGLVEKPEPAEAPSNLGIVGRYILEPEIFDVLKETPAGKGGEIQITDALQLLRQRRPIYAYQFQGDRYDTGTFLGLLKATIALGLKHPELGEGLRAYLRQLHLEA